jgi:hypothetical protein
MRPWRISLAVAGILLGLFGAMRLLTEVPIDMLIVLAIWMIAAIVIHDGVVSPLIIVVGWALARWIPPRARRYVQFSLIVAGLIAVIAIPLAYREDTQPQAESMLQQNYLGNLTFMVSIVAAISLVAYAIRVANDGRGSSVSTGP